MGGGTLLLPLANAGGAGGEAGGLLSGLMGGAAEGNIMDEMMQIMSGRPAMMTMPGAGGRGAAASGSAAQGDDLLADPRESWCTAHVMCTSW